MYRPEKYQKDDQDFIFRFIQENPFASFIVKGDRLLATHIPVLVKGDAENFTLYGHIANHNEQLSYLKDGTEALLIFHGPHSYISSSWYKEKDISTWDYTAVHVNARIKLQSEKELEESLVKLVAHFEKEQKKPLYYEDLPDKMLEEHLPLITGFWLEPVKVQGIAKLHQSYESEDIHRVTQHLKQGGSMEQELCRYIKTENGME